MLRTTKTALFACTALILSAIAAKAETIDFSKGFAKDVPLAVNQIQRAGEEWEALSDNRLILTPGHTFLKYAPEQALSAFYPKPVNVATFKTAFTFRIRGEMEQYGNGFAFVIQNAPEGKAAIGKPGAGLGYAGITRSIAIKFDNEMDKGDPSESSTGLFAKGEIPIGGNDLKAAGIDLSSGHLMQATIAYYDKVLYVYIYDLENGAYAEQKYEIDLPSVLGSRNAFVGFTGSTTTFGCREEIQDWYYYSPDAVVSLTADKYLVMGGSAATGTVSIGGAAPYDTKVVLTTSNEAAAVPDVVVVPAGQSSVTFPIKTAPVKENVISQIRASFEKTTLTANVTVRPIQLSGVSIKNNFVAEGTVSSAILNLEAPAAPGPIVINLTSANPQAVAVSPTVIVPAGATSVELPIYTGGVDNNTPVLVTASTGGARQTGSITVRPLRPINLYLSTATVAGGTELQGKVELEAPAPKGGRVVKLGSANANVAGVPATVTVPEGWTTQVFAIKTSAVKTGTSVRLAATVGSATVYATLTVKTR